MLCVTWQSKMAQVQSPASNVDAYTTLSELTAKQKFVRDVQCHIKVKDALSIATVCSHYTQHGPCLMQLLRLCCLEQMSMLPVDIGLW